MSNKPETKNETAVVAFSGGLDTSFMIPFVKEKYGFKKVITCTVNTGGFSKDEEEKIASRSKEIKADEHFFIDAKKEYYDEVLKYLIYGNTTRDGYPLCVGAERIIQGKVALEVCKKVSAKFLVNGSTGAGNDQYRWDLIVAVLGDDKITGLTPVREFQFSREYETKYLQDLGISVQSKNTSYSYNAGMWGVSIGGKETHISTEILPEEAWYSHPDTSKQEIKLQINFKNGEPISCSASSGESAKNPVDVILLLASLGNSLGIGRGYHIGTSIPGKKGRIGFEAPAAEILYSAHKTLEKITLSQHQIHFKNVIANEYGKLLHEAKFFDPCFEDLKAYLISSQAKVTGECTVYLKPFRIEAVTADSPHNLLHLKGATYGESASAWSGAEAEGACKIAGYEQLMLARTK